MTKDVLVSIAGLHTAENEVGESEDETIEILSAGTYYFKNGKHYVLFEEISEDFSEVTKSQIKWIGNEMLEVSKKGISTTHMIFEKKKKNRCIYNTPYGQLDLGIYTTDIKVEEKEDEVLLRADYLLDVNSEPLFESTIRIRIQSKDSKDFSIRDRIEF